MCTFALLLFFLSCVVVGSGEMLCPGGFEETFSVGVCAGVRLERVDWFDARQRCSSLKADLAWVADDAVARVVALGLEGLYAWTGSYFDGTKVVGAASAAAGTEAGVFSCIAAHDGKGLVALPCDTELKYICTAGVDGCVWKGRELLFSDGGNRSVVVSPQGKVTVDGVPAGSGAWSQPSVFETGPANSLCPSGGRWRAAVTRTASSYSIAAGCSGVLEEGSFPPGFRPWVELTPEERGSFHDGGNLDRDTRTARSGGGNPSPLEGTPSLPGMDDAPRGSVEEKKRRPAPVVLIAIVAAVAALIGASSVAALGMLRKQHPSGAAKALKPPQHQQAVPEETHPDGPCEVCSRFDEGAAISRFAAVHATLAQELARPLIVNKAHCLHSKGEHVHVFSVQNTFQAHTLGALSTVYSRTKPRLPRSTRIHIAQGEQLAGGNDDDEEGTKSSSTEPPCTPGRPAEEPVVVVEPANHEETRPPRAFQHHVDSQHQSDFAYDLDYIAAQYY